MEMKAQSSIGNMRNSGIELVKIIGMILIVISHMTQTLCTPVTVIPDESYIVDLSAPTVNIQYLVLSILGYGGTIGNMLFFISSAWFLVDSKKVDKEKWFFMLVEMYTISFVILILAYIFRSGDVDSGLIRISLLPISYSFNWYVVCYLLFYPTHVYWNTIIESIGQKRHFRLAFALMFLYMIMNFIYDDMFFPSSLINWIMMYFIVAYVKKYLMKQVSDRKVSIILILGGLIGYIGIICLTNVIELKTSVAGKGLLYWNKNSNPFIFMFALGLVCITANSEFKNRFINEFSRLSMLIYITHENVIFRTYYRPLIIKWFYEKYGYDHILVGIMLLSLVLFVIDAVLCYLYVLLFQKHVRKLSKYVCDIVSESWEDFESRVL